MFLSATSMILNNKCNKFNAGGSVLKKLFQYGQRHFSSATVLSQRYNTETSQKKNSADISGACSTAVVFGGFGFRSRQMKKHAALYEQYDFDVVDILSTVKELTTPSIGEARGKLLAEKIQKIDQPIVVHSISGSFWTMIYMFEHLDPEWREENVKAIVFDSCPPKSDIYAFGGWLSFMLKKHYLKNYVAHLFYPYMWYCGITDEWRKWNHSRMFGASAVIPRNAHCIFMHGKMDPVLNYEYLNEFIEDIKKYQHPSANVSEIQFERSRHAMSVVDYPEEYKKLHVNHLLRMVPEWVDENSFFKEFVMEASHDRPKIEV